MSQELTYLIALGANLPSGFGDPETTLRAALRRLAESGAHDLRASRLFHTPCFPPGTGPDYVNAAARFRSVDSPEVVLRMLHAIEAEFGRERATRWGQRTLDLDLLASGDTVLPDRGAFEVWRALPSDQQGTSAPDHLILPHPRLQDRAFVLVPLAEIAPDWTHPVLGLSVLEMLQNLDKSLIDEVRPV